MNARNSTIIKVSLALASLAMCGAFAILAASCANSDTGSGGNGGSSGSGGGGGGGGGAAGGSSGSLLAGFTVDDGGYVTAGAWHGWAWPATETPNLGTTMTPTPSALTDPATGQSGTGFGSVKAGDQLCVSGVVAASSVYGGVALLGFGLDQDKTPANAALNTWTPTGTGVQWAINNTGASPLRIQIQGTAGYPTAAWCSVLTGSSGQIKFTDFNSQCWPGGSGTNYDLSVPLNQIMVEVPGSNTTTVPFNFCLLGMVPY